MIAMMVAVGSVKGAPGATTFALALAVVWPQRVVLVETDPAGGDLGGRFGVPDTPGLGSLIVAARHGMSPDLLLAHTNRLSVGADAVVAPAAGRQAHAAVAGLAERPPSHGDVDVILDVGRLHESSPAWGLATLADVLFLVSGTDLASLDHTAAWTNQHSGQARMSVVLVGGGRFSSVELADVFGVEVAVRTPADRRTAAVLTGSARTVRGWTRFGVPAAARTVAFNLRPGATAKTPAPSAMLDHRAVVPAEGETR